MKLNDIRDLTKEDLLARLGLTISPTTGQRLGSTLGILAVGLLVGAGVALLLAPKSGRELRSDLEEGLGDARRRADEAVAGAIQTARNAVTGATT